MVEPDAGADAVAREVVDASYAIRSELGAGLLERAYRIALADELSVRGLEVETEVAVPVVVRGRVLSVGFRADLVVARRVVVEVKAVPVLLPIHEAQTLNYLRLTKCPIGLLVNFGEGRLKDGIHRYVMSW